jgi:sec-independent protein translocase protein TatC
MNFKWLAGLGLFALVIGTVLAEPFYLFLKGLLPVVKWVAYAPFDGFMLLMWCGLSISLFLFALVLIVWIWKEYNDILKLEEKSFLLKSLVPALILFVIGFVFGLVIYTQLMLPFFVETNIGLGLENYWNLYQVITSGLKLSLLLGLSFLFPLVLRGLIKLGLIQKDVLKKQRGLVVIIILVLSAVITPTPDILSMLIVALPLYSLFELSLV